MKTILSALFLLLVINASGQSKDSSNWKLEINRAIFSHGYLFQGDHSYELGFKIQLRKRDIPQWKKDWEPISWRGKLTGFRVNENIGLITGIHLNWNNNINYIDPFVTLRYMYPLKRLSFFTSSQYFTRHYSEILTHHLCFEIGIKIGELINISYGRNLITYENLGISSNRFAVRIQLD